MTEKKRAARVAVVDNSIDPDVYRPVEHWSRYLDVPWDAYVAREGKFPSVEAYTHVIMTGSEASILEREPWVDEEAELVRQAVGGGNAVLGSCWGHQLIAFALLGESSIGRCARPEIGWIALRVEPESGLLGPAGTQYVFSVHYDEVRNLPESFEVLASTEACPVQAFRIRDKPVWGLQCHPEMDIPTGSQCLRALAARDFKGRDFILEALRESPRDSGLIHRVIRGFLAARPSRGETLDFA